MQEFCSPDAMDEVIEILVVTQSIDVAGGAVSSTAPFPTARPLWAKVERQRGSENVEADLPTAMTRATIQTRFVPNVSKDMRIVWQGVEWEVVDIDPQPRHDRLIVFIERRGESGSGDPR